MNATHKVVLLLAIAACSTFGLAQTAQTGGCDAKRQALEQEIEYAKAHGNSHRVAGLEAALSQVKANCSEASLDSKRQRKVSEAQQKVAEQEQALQEAKASGKSQKKIAERERKLSEAHEALERAQIDAAK